MTATRTTAPQVPGASSDLPDDTPDDGPSDVAPGGSSRRRRRLWVALAALVGLVVVAGVVTWVVVGRGPHIGPGPVWVGDPEAFEDTHPADDLHTSYVLDPSDGTWDGLWSFRNAGSFPVTVRIHPVYEPGEEVHETFDYTLVRLRPSGFLKSDLENTVDALRVEPGQKFGVLVSVGMGCSWWETGGAFGIDRLELDVTTFGFTRRVTVEGNVEVRVRETTNHSPGPECDNA